jgi:predicted nuclease of predicted toxin-antitoxin system
MDFLANENFPLLSVRLLREAGHRVVSIIQEAPGSKDEDILKRAHTERLIILTFDRDYGRQDPTVPKNVLVVIARKKQERSMHADRI